jgi:hypothetical protein
VTSRELFSGLKRCEGRIWLPSVSVKGSFALSSKKVQCPPSFLAIAFVVSPYPNRVGFIKNSFGVF